jgi:hypothetical protein
MPPSAELPPHLVDAALAMLGAGRPATLPIQGRSMEPTLPDGSQIVVDFAARSLRRGDLVVFRQGREVVVHRYLGTARFPDGRPCLRTRGDGLLYLDPPCAPESVLGKVLLVRRDGIWRDLRGRGAAAYARGVAWHAYFWAACGVAAERFQRGRGGAWRLTRRLDRALLRLVDGLLFRRLLRPAPPPSS